MQDEPGEFISSIFVRPKKDGTNRMILNLKDLNQHVQYFHFKMETLIDAIRLMTPNCFMGSVDLKELNNQQLVESTSNINLQVSLV